MDGPAPRTDTQPSWRAAGDAGGPCLPLAVEGSGPVVIGLALAVLLAYAVVAGAWTVYATAAACDQAGSDERTTEAGSAAS